MNTPELIQAAETKLRALDPVLGSLITSQEPIVYTPRTDYFSSLCRSILGQQVSVASAATVFARLETSTHMTVATIAALTPDQAKTIGLSRQKYSYLKDLAAHFVNNPHVYDHLEEQSDQQVITELTAVKGIGIWTAQMFLMFTLTRLDVFAPADIGLTRAMKLLYKWDDTPDKQELERVSDQWRPYRTVACWHLWKSLHVTPGQ
ncbi:MAG TPA: DNA-3-methyladenine glycosylase 2 family protein [Candidatus Saccharimonadia bacterium]|nr:DNA-3-methyladenine glycosylase 2 family protein [Candidatus Saccharimonadia bacterium]